MLGQMLLLLGAALFVAQLVNFAIILSGQQRLTLAQSEGPAINRFVQVAAQITQDPRSIAELRDRGISGRGAEFSTNIDNLVDRTKLPRDRATESRLVAALDDAGITVRQARASTDFRVGRITPQERGQRPGRKGRVNRGTILLAAQLDDGTWLNGRLDTPRRDPWLVYRLALSTLALYVFALGAVLWIGSRLARPLRDLTRAAGEFESRGEAGHVVPRGPGDVRKAVEAFNDMNQRVNALLEEKDRMLGAIGHDLRTPLASLRIRVENIEAGDPEPERMLSTIDEMSATLEDILVLARTGKEREEAKSVELGALLDALVEEYRERGEDVKLVASDQLVARIQVNLIRRAVRNLIDNALAYGERARVRVSAQQVHAVITVEDDGPGIPENKIQHVLQPFARLDESRNRDTGGSGLGLTIANAVANSHGGRLGISNQLHSGLRVTLAIPLSGCMTHKALSDSRSPAD